MGLMCSFGTLRGVNLYNKNARPGVAWVCLEFCVWFPWDIVLGWLAPQLFVFLAATCQVVTVGQEAGSSRGKGLGKRELLGDQTAWEAHTSQVFPCVGDCAGATGTTVKLHLGKKLGDDEPPFGDHKNLLNPSGQKAPPR